MTFIFRNRTIFWDISKWNRGQTKWDGGSKLVRLGIKYVVYPILKDYIAFKPNKSNIFTYIYLDYSNISFP